MSRFERQLNGWIIVLLLWIALTFRLAVKLPVEAFTTGDSAGYLALVAYRPPVYGWVVNAFNWITGGLAYWPVMQCILLAATLLVFAIELGRMLDSRLAAGAAVLLILKHHDTYYSPAWLMSEGVFTPLILAGLALLFRSVRRGGEVSILVATACFAFATGTRAAGAAFLLAPLLFALLDRRRSLATAVMRASQITVMAGVVLVLVMSGNWLKNGQFDVGSWSGISLLGKGLLLVEPTDPADLPPPVAVVAPASQDLRRLIAAQPDLGARLRAQGQAYQDLRFALFFPAAEETWPVWASADWRTRGEQALALSKLLIERHPREYVGLWAHDWMALVLYPEYWPNWATSTADGSLFPFCRMTGNCWALMNYETSTVVLLGMLVTSLVGTAGGGALLVFRCWRVLRRRAEPTTALFWSLALVLQATLLMSSAFEVGAGRYTIGANVLGVALLLWFLSMLPIHVLYDFDRSRLKPGRWLGACFRALSALFPSDALRFSTAYTSGVLVGVVIFGLCFRFNVLSAFHILFYRGISLLIVAMLMQMVVLGVALGRGRRGVGYVLPMALSSLALNLTFFVLIPVNLDRSISVFLLAWMEDHRGTPQTKADLRQAFQQIYVEADGAIDRRIVEQLVSGNIAPRGGGYALTERGSYFVAIAREIGLLFATDQRFLHPSVVAKTDVPVNTTLTANTEVSTALPKSEILGTPRSVAPDAANTP
jgi:hypothetical protein